MNVTVPNPFSSEGAETSRNRVCRRDRGRRERCAQSWHTQLARGFCLIASVCMVILAPPCLAQERVLTEDSPPTSVPEIETPIQKVFPVEEPVRPSLFGSKLEGKNPFIAGTQLELRFRSYNWYQDALDASITADWAGGGSIYYQSSRFKDLFAIELEAFTSQPLWAPEDRRGGGNLQADGSGYSVVGIANADFQFSGMNLKIGRQYLDLPYVNKADIRMTPNTFESITLERPKSPVKFTLGYTSKIKFRNSDRFVPMTEFLGLEVDHGLIHGGVVWEPDANFSMGAIGQFIPDVFAGIYGEVLWFRVKPDDKLDFRLDSQGTYTRGHGDNLTNIDTEWNAAIRGSLDYGKFLFRLGFSATGPEAIKSPFGLQPSYVDLMSRTFTKADEKAFLGSVSYDFSDLGAKGFKANLVYAQSYDAIFRGERITAREANLNLDYRGQKGWWKGLWIRLRQAYRQESWTEEDLYQLRFQVYYTLNIL